MTSMLEELKALASVDLFREGRTGASFIGRPFYFDYNRLKLLVNDKWKHQVGGLPEGCLLLLAYDGEPDVSEFILARVVGPTSLPSDSDVVSSMVEYYKEEAPPTGESAGNRLDTFTRYEFMFSGIECRILGTFYRSQPSESVAFGADVENFFSPHNYSAYKPSGRVLEFVVNFRENSGIPGGADDMRIGCVRYSSTRRLAAGPQVPIYVSTLDFIGKRTALFGMTRTGKSNTVKKLVEATVRSAGLRAEDGSILDPVGQIIFDVNGEYANPNPQDEGTAIFEAYATATTRYSILDKPGFRVMKLNFHRDIEAGFGMLATLLADRDANYLRSFLSVDFGQPPAGDKSATTRWERLIAAYRACLHLAGFASPTGDRVRFQGEATLNQLSGFDPTQGLSIDEAAMWFSRVWENHASHAYITAYPASHQGREWANEDLKAVLVMLTRRRSPTMTPNIDGFRVLRPFAELHTSTAVSSFENDIVATLRSGRIVIVDLSQGEASVQATYSERICGRIFADAMERFVSNDDTNYIQMYFEEAHNIFPRQSMIDLKNVYNRIAKEGAKLRLGMTYATQEVTSISHNILKNTQNWFIAHLNNRDELREVEKFYDFSDFSESILRSSDKGFIRMKTYSNSFVLPVQVDRFSVKQTNGIQ